MKTVRVLKVVKKMLLNGGMSCWLTVDLPRFVIAAASEFSPSFGLKFDNFLHSFKVLLTTWLLLYGFDLYNFWFDNLHFI